VAEIATKQKIPTRNGSDWSVSAILAGSPARAGGSAVALEA
jgi:hypothetical protein